MNTDPNQFEKYLDIPTSPSELEEHTLKAATFTFEAFSPSRPKESMMIRSFVRDLFRGEGEHITVPIKHLRAKIVSQLGANMHDRDVCAALDLEGFTLILDSRKSPVAVNIPAEKWDAFMETVRTIGEKIYISPGQDIYHIQAKSAPGDNFKRYKGGVQ